MKQVFCRIDEQVLTVAVRTMARMRRREGQGMIEYAMIIALVAVVVIVGYRLLGEQMLKFIQDKVLPVFG